MEPDMIPAIVLRQGVWMASRWGIGGELLHPVTHRPDTARHVISTLHDHVRDALDESGDAAYVEEALDRILNNGTGATRQRQAYERNGLLANVVTHAIGLTHQEPFSDNLSGNTPLGWTWKRLAEVLKLEADTRATQRNIHGRREWIKDKEGRDMLSSEPIGATSAYRERLLTRLAGQQDQLTYWKQIRAEQIATGKATNYSRETINKGDYVRYRFGWVEVVRTNAKTVSVKTAYTWTDKIEYEALTDHMTAAEYAGTLSI